MGVRDRGHLESGRQRRWSGRSKGLVAGLAALALVTQWAAAASATNWGAGKSQPGYNVLCTDYLDPEYQASECSANTNVHFLYWYDSTVHAQLATEVANSYRRAHVLCVYRPVPQHRIHNVLKPHLHRHWPQQHPLSHVVPAARHRLSGLLNCEQLLELRSVPKTLCVS